MISRSRALLESQFQKLRIPCNLLHVLLFVFCYSFTAHSGKQIINSFSNTTDNLHIVISDTGFTLGDKYRLLVKVFGDTIKNSSTNSNYPDIIAHSTDTFQFFYVAPISKAVFRSSVKLTESSVLDTNPKKFADIDPFSGIFLHADRSDNEIMLSYVQKISTGAVLTAENGRGRINIDTSNFYDYIASSQCFLGNDTFLIANSIEANQLKLRKIAINGPVITAVSEIEIEKDSVSTQRHLTNCAVSYDNDDAVLVVWSRGPPNAPRKMHFKIFNRELTSSLYGVLDTLICDNSFYHYDDVVLFSYGAGKFAVVFWNSNGVAMYQLSISAGVVQKTYKPIFIKSDLKYCTAQFNGNYLAIIANGDVDGDGKSGIEGEVFDFNNGVLSNGKKIRFSDPNSGSAKILDQNSTAINCAIDNNGNIGVTWRDSAMVQGCVWANRGIKFQQGYWSSDIKSFSDSANDSIRIYPMQVFKSKWNQNNWFLEDSIRIGNTADQCANAQWQSFSNDTILTTNRFFQLRIAINRKSDRDSIATPVIDSVSVRWNIKPKFNCIDSVRIGNVSKNISFGDTIFILSRKDTSSIYLSIFDPDQKDTIRLRGSRPAENTVKVLRSGPVFKASIKIPVISKSDSISTCTLSAWDALNWQASPVNIKVKTRNSVPVLKGKIVLSENSENPDTLNLPQVNTIFVQENDSIQFLYSAQDTNDPLSCKTYLSYCYGNTETKLDSSIAGINKKFTFLARNFNAVDTMYIKISAVDIDTSVEINTRIIINHSPEIRFCRINSDTIFEGDTVRVTLKQENRIYVAVSDTDCFFWDSLLYKFIVKNSLETIYSNLSETSYLYVPQRADTMMKIIVNDKFGKTDSIRFYVKFPWLETDSVVNSEYVNSIEALSNGSSLIIGNGIGDTMELPFLNNGNDSMHFSAIRFVNDSRKWLSVSIVQDTGYSNFSFTNYSSFKPVLLKPDSSIRFTFMFSGLQLQGDSVVFDTLIITTSDPSHPQINIPVRMEYNDLPEVISVETWFPSDIPYTGLARKRAYQPYWFPPHASFSVSFSEPMDSASAHSGIRVYSVFDSIFTGKAEPVGLRYYWSQNYTKVNIRPSYKQKSSYFNILPPEGLFIPTDSLAIVLSSELTDRAKTPHGPNNLDINKDFQRDSSGDTSVSMAVDSITFTLLSVSPSPGDTSISQQPEITLTFNAPVYAASVDTSLQNNRSLNVFSRFNNNRTIHFESISVDSNKVRFRLGRTLFFGDSLWCRFRSCSVRDMMGFPSDNDENGIAVSLMDTSFTDDDVRWEYKVKKVNVISVIPDSGEKVKDVSPAIQIFFSDSLPFDVFDTSTQNNRSLYVKSQFSADAVPFKSIEMASDKKSIIFQPKVKFFSDDSIHCYFRGFTKNYRYSRSTNFPEGADEVFGAYDWHFFTGNIGFYTYPNPYKPGKNKLHCEQNGPCGIWFKNLHVLKRGINDVKIKVFSMNAHPVYDSQKDGVSIHFETNEISGKPEWLWDTRNQSGDLVASGLYLYAVYDLSGNVLIKGKLIIVR